MKICKRIKAGLYCVFFIISVLFVILCFCFTDNQNKIWQIRRIWAKIQLKITGIKLEFEGEFNQNATMIVMNHQSMLDIIALEAFYPKNLAWVAKKEIKDLPIFKQTMIKPKLICVDRKNPRSLLKVLKEAKERLMEGRILAIFPDGTRSKDGKIRPFQVGAKVLADKLDLKVQPLLIANSASLLDSKEFTLSSGTLKIICFDLVDTSKENWLEETRQAMQKKLDEFNQANSTSSSPLA